MKHRVGNDLPVREGRLGLTEDARQPRLGRAAVQRPRTFKKGLKRPTGRRQCPSRFAGPIPGVELESRQGTSFTSDDGLIAFILRRSLDGVLMERRRSGTASRRISQAVRFDGQASFLRWCEEDAFRFTYPLLFANLRRSSPLLFGSDD
jgi:hypothetical protein